MLTECKKLGRCLLAGLLLSSGIGLVNVCMSDALEEFLQSREKQGYRPAYVQSLRDVFRQFSKGREAMMVHEITPSIILDFAQRRNWAQATWAAHLGRLSAFFTYAKRRGWCHLNPCDQIERVRVIRKPPKVMNPDEIQLAMASGAPRFRLHLVLALIVGIRPAELRRLKKDDITKDWIRVDAAASKVAQRRIVKLDENQRAWIAWAGDAQIPLAKIYIRRQIRKLRTALGWTAWPQDILRHTALSYQAACGKPIHDLVLEAGTSIKMFRTHYNGLVTPEQAEQFKEMTP